jgi:hypothetical protein
MIRVQLLASAFLVGAVLFFMWRLPRGGDRFFGVAPWLALLSAWAGLLAVAGSLALWVAPAPDALLTALFLVIDPGAVALGTLVLWVYRGHAADGASIEAQLTQARVGIGLGLVAVAVGYGYVVMHKPPDVLPF